MIPTNNGSSAPCNPISSNCVIWQGPDIPCINLCNGDTVSEVIAKLAQELCDIIDATCDCNPDLRELKLNCIPPPSQENPDLAQYLNAIIEYVCAIPTGPDNIIVELPDCLHYNNAQGNPVTALPIDEYALYLANTICDILDAIAIINNQISELIERIVVLENCVLPCNPSTGGDPLVVSKCIIPGGQPGPASVLLLALESAFCAHVALVGDNIELQAAINAQCIDGTFLSLTTGTSYGSGRSWVVNANTLAASHQNQWAVICDLYNAVSDIQQNCCDSGCDGVNILYTADVRTDDSTGAATAIAFNFSATTIPQGFTDCGSSIILTDSQGNVISTNFNVVGSALGTGSSGSVAPVVIQIGTLDITAPINAQVITCVSGGNEQCNDSTQISIPMSVPCPQVFNIVPKGDAVVFQWSNSLGNTVTYDWSATFVETGSQVAGGLITNPGTNLSAVVDANSLTPGLTLQFTVVITTASGASVTCPLGTYDIPGVNCTSVLHSGTSKDTTIAGTDIYLGRKNLGDAQKPYYYDPINGLIKQPPTEAGNGYCKNPELSWDTTVSANGTFDIKIDSRNATPGDITVAWSADFINWTDIGTFQPASFPNTITVNTGVAAGSIYVKALENCLPNGLFPSKLTILRYDFNTNQQTVFSDAENCQELLGTPLQPLACPAGIQVAKGAIECDNVSYQVPGSNSMTRSYWAYVGKYQAQASEPIYYVYSAWTELGDCTAVLLCCECPAFIMPWKITKQLQVPVGGDTTITVPYLIGDGTPVINVIQNPICGTLSQSSTFNNQFVYQQNGSDQCIGDTITLEISTVVQGACSSSTVTIPITIMGSSVGSGRPNKGDVNVFVNTSSFSTADAAAVKSVIDKLESETKAECPEWDAAGYGYNIIPTTDSAWLGYGKAMIVGETGASLNGSPEWVAIRRLPSEWTSGKKAKSCAILVMSNGSSPDYHDPTLVSGWGAFPNGQPTAKYLQNYDEHLDILTGSQTSAFGISQGFDGNPYFESGYQIAVLPITMDVQSVTAANILQQFGAYAGRLIAPNEYGIITDPDLANYMMQGIANAMPYFQAVTSGGNMVEGLRTKNITGFWNQPGESSMADTLTSIANLSDEGYWVEKGVYLFKDGQADCPTPADPPVVVNNYFRLQEYNEECALTDIVISILEDPAKTLKVGDVVRTAGPGGKETCWQVQGTSDTGTNQAYTIETDCITCTNNLE